MQQAFDLGDTHLVLFKIVREITSAGSFIAHYAKILASDGAIGEMDFGVPAIHPPAAEPGPPQGDGAIASPILWIVILTPDGEMDCGRTLPFPFPEKFIQPRRSERTHCAGSNCALDV